MAKFAVKFVIFAALINCGFGLPRPKTGGWTLRIIHTNDMHARFEQTSALSSKCHENDAKAGKCYGGFARIATLVRQTRNSSVPSLFLNAGDTYQGTVWFSVYKWKIVAEFLNLLQPDAISLGNHEFDDGPVGLVPFINAARFPIVTANLNLTDEPDLAATKLRNSVILNVTGHRIGVIGYLTPDTKVIANSGKVKFVDEVEAIRTEVKVLQAEGVNILIALGHSGFEMDKRIAAEVDGLDLVIGGHTNTFLYTGNKPNLEIPEGLYPTEVTQKSGRKVYVVQAYAYTKYLGNLTVDFDDHDEIKSIQGNPILVDSSIEEARDILDELDKWRPAIDNLTHTPVGSSRVLLDGDSKHCRCSECNLGNLITDAMIDYNARQYGGKDGWTNAAIALHNGGSIRTSIDRAPDDKITMSDILAVLPFNNVMVSLNMTGRQILEILEHSVKYAKINDTSNLFGGFLQYSGLQVTYDLSRPSGSRVVPNSVMLRCAACRVPTYSELELDQIYEILTIDFLRSGGDKYETMLDLKWTALGVTSDEVLIDYLKRKSPVHPGVEWRINFLESNELDENDSRTKNSATQVYGSVIMIFILFFST